MHEPRGTTTLDEAYEPHAPQETRFVWPPKDGQNRHEHESTPADPARVAPVNALIESVELDLLARTGLSFDRWAARTGWSPDPREARCWRCAGLVGPYECDGEGCARCRSKPLAWDRAMCLGAYDGPLREHILGLKFNGWRPSGDGLGKFAGERISSELQRSQIDPEHARIIPIPMHPIRRVHRGVDHTRILARSASTASTITWSPLLRARYRPEQIGLSSTARARNIRDGFRIDRRKGRRLRSGAEGLPRVWVLVDDVRTTGATFVSACKVLRRFGRSLGLSREEQPKIWVCSIAVASSDRRSIKPQPDT